MLKFSKFVHFFEKDEAVAIFHALTRKVVFVCKTDLTRIAEALSSDNTDDDTVAAIEYLLQSGLIVTAEADESAELAKLQSKILQRPSIDTLYLLLTDNCNFACNYCFFKGSYCDPNEKLSDMTNEIAISSLRQFAKHLKKASEYPDFKPSEPSVVFYGGEPFLNTEVFFAAVEEIAAMKKSGLLPNDLAININTNASLIDDEIAAFCAKHEIEVDVSLDGYKSVNDACRVWRGNGKGTFDDIIRGIDILRVARTKTCISCTVSETNVDELPAIFNWFLDGVGISNVGFNPLLNSHQYKIDDPDYPQKVATAMIKCFEIARERGIYEARMMRKVRSFVDDTIYDRDCCGCGKQMVVLPSGNIGVCHAYSGTGQYFIKSDEEFDPYQHQFWKEWSQRSPLNMPQCHGCEALTICGGGCPHNADINKGSIWELDEHFCLHAKETLRWLIWDLYEKTK
ncbi:MAG: SPASM domain-containing protein [Candidatus Berkelbacteria bacterium]|nr:SPASM domain-containing protein [Candidatus Berkelbacteria bacterium]